MHLRFDITKVLQFQEDEAKCADDDGNGNGDSFEESNQ